MLFRRAGALHCTMVVCLVSFLLLGSCTVCLRHTDLPIDFSVMLVDAWVMNLFYFVYASEFCLRVKIIFLCLFVGTVCLRGFQFEPNRVYGGNPAKIFPRRRIDKCPAQAATIDVEELMQSN